MSSSVSNLFRNLRLGADTRLYEDILWGVFLSCTNTLWVPLLPLQIVANSFLANLSTSALFATILVEYLLERLPEMGSNVELSNLYLKLFKLVFGSVSLFAAENEQMLKVSGWGGGEE